MCLWQLPSPSDREASEESCSAEPYSKQQGGSDGECESEGQCWLQWPLSGGVQDP